MSTKLCSTSTHSHRTSRERFGNAQVLREWFSTLLLYSNMASLAGPYSDFGTIAGAAIDMVAESRRRQLSREDRDRILSGTRSLPAHADVRPGLERMQKEGFRLVTLTNSSPAPSNSN
jgi:2-haloacid dehalogenase